MKTPIREGAYKHGRGPMASTKRKLKAHYNGILHVENIPIFTRDGFKAACDRRGKSMRQVLISFMKNYYRKTFQAEKEVRRHLSLKELRQKLAERSIRRLNGEEQDERE